MPKTYASTTSLQDFRATPIDWSGLSRKYVQNQPADRRPAYGYTVTSPNVTGDFSDFSEYDEADEHFWGTPKDWKIVNAELLSSDEFDEVAQYLRDTGRASV